MAGPWNLLKEGQRSAPAGRTLLTHGEGNEVVPTSQELWGRPQPCAAAPKGKFMHKNQIIIITKSRGPSLQHTAEAQGRDAPLPVCQ